MKKIIYTALFFCFAVTLATAQETPFFSKALSINPLYLKSSGIRINYEKQIRASKHWMYVSPMIFFENDTKLTDEVQGNLFSYGAEFGAMYKFDKENNPFGIYIHYGVMARNTEISYAGVVWTETLVDDLVYWELKEQSLKKQIYQLGGVVALGYKSKFANSMFIDCSIGVCGRYSIINFDYPNDNVNLNTAPWNLGYSGFGTVIGLSLGTYF